MGSKAAAGRLGASRVDVLHMATVILMKLSQGTYLLLAVADSHLI
jgi:hypothetical protein